MPESDPKPRSIIPNNHFSLQRNVPLVPQPCGGVSLLVGLILNASATRQEQDRGEKASIPLRERSKMKSFPFLLLTLSVTKVILHPGLLEQSPFPLIV